MWQGKLIRESTKQGNDKVARQMEAAHRTSLARGEVGLRDKKPSPTLAESIDNRFEPWAKATFEKTSPKTWRDYYKVGIKTIRNYGPQGNSKLTEITSETASGFGAYRQAQGMQVTTVNSSLQILRRMLRLAVEWGVSESAPLVRMLPGARHREQVVTFDEEARYLASCSRGNGTRFDNFDRHRPKARGMLSITLGGNHLVQRKIRHLHRNAWKNRRNETRSANEPASEGDPRSALGERREAIRRLDLACCDSQWSPRIFQS